VGVSVALGANLACLRVWLWLFFILKCIKMMFFHLLKIIFEINILKQFKKYKKINF